MSMVSTTTSSFDRMDAFCRGAFGVLFGERITALREEQETDHRAGRRPAPT